MTPTDDGAQGGRVVAVRGGVVDAEFPDRLPPMNALLRAGGDGDVALEVASQLDAATVRCIALTPTRGLARGHPVQDTGGTLVDVARSVSRAGGDAQLPACRAVAGNLRLASSRFQELESFARFSTRLDESTRKTLDRGRRVREVLEQPVHDTMPVLEQLAVLFAVTEGLLDEVPLDEVGEVEAEIRRAVRVRHRGLAGSVQRGVPVSAERNVEERADGLEMAARRKRQQQITEELLDIVSGFEAIQAGSDAPG